MLDENALDGSLFGDLHQFVVVDLFCGLGGTSEGVRMALGYDPIAAVNHWDYAIDIHSQNHPMTIHFREDVFQVEPWVAARGRTIDLLIGSPDCTHHSNAKGSAPKDTGRRALADVFVKWAQQVRPNVIMLENVRELLSWGPLDEAGHPIKGKAGEHWRQWVLRLEAEGYRVEWRLLKACDYGAPTSRTRLFVIARCDGKSIHWPKPTHGGIGQPAHKTAASCIDWSIPCKSIFGRKKDLAEATQRRIAQGIQKYVLDNPRPFLLNFSHGGRLEPVDAPLNTITTTKGGERALILPIMQAAFLSRQFGNSIGASLRLPLPTITAGGGGKSALVAALLTKFYGSGGNQSVSAPLDTATVKARFGLVTVNIQGEPYQITDIGMRMLEPRELARAQGFPETYKMTGSKADQIAGIGNSVVPQIIEALVRVNLRQG